MSGEVSNNGRNIDPKVGILVGEGAEQRVTGPNEQVAKQTPRAWDQVPSVDDVSPAYYDRPLLKESVWTIDIPLYYYLGGTAGAALALGSAIQWIEEREGDRPLRRLAQQCHWVGTAASTIGSVFLVHDLGRPSRFLHMVRVFRPTSPMNVGAWILSGAAPAAIAAALFTNRPGILGWIGDRAGYMAGIFGAGLATYTGVLVSNGAVPIWQESRRWMPVLFGASAVASAAAVLDVLPQKRVAAQAIAIYGTVGRVMELAAGRQVEISASRVPRVGVPFRSGAPATLWKAAKVLTAASLVVSFAPIKPRVKRTVAAVLATAGSVCLRFAVHYLTNASVRDPRAAFEQQRRK